jgi:hypothetical protein
VKSLFHRLSTCASFTAKLDNCTSKLAHLEFTFSRLSIVACAVVMFVRDGRPRRVVQCRSHPGFPLCKHNYWVASLKNSFNIETGISSIPDIKLIRTDTTLDLSQKAEKGMLNTDAQGSCKYICTSKKLKLKIWVDKLKA